MLAKCLVLCAIALVSDLGSAKRVRLDDVRGDAFSSKFVEAVDADETWMPMAPLRHVGTANAVGRAMPPLLSDEATQPEDAFAFKADLKQRLVDSAQEFRAAQEALWQQQRLSDSTGSNDDSRPLVAESVANIDVTDESLLALRNATIRCIQQLAACNPTAAPFEGWGTPEGTGLDGEWELLFTNAADATFKPGDKGKATTSQIVDSRKRLFSNCINFVPANSADTKERKRSSKIEGFRVEIVGKRLSDTEVQLFFKRVKLLRPGSRIPFLRTIVIPLPPSWLVRSNARRIARRKGAKLSDRGAGFTMLYLDDTMRVHQTFDGQYFVQCRRQVDT